MSKKNNDMEYICLSAILRAKEAKLLNQAKLDRMLSEANFSDSCRIATEAGYEDMSGKTVQEVNACLAAHRAKELEEIRELLPDESVLDLYRMRYGYHNAKVLVKSKGDPKLNASMFSQSCRYSIEELLEAYNAEEYFGPLPAVYAQAIRDAKQALARTNNPQLADFILDKAYYSEELKEAQLLQKPFFTEFVRHRIDRTNLCSTLRTLYMGKRGELLQHALVEGGHISVDEILNSMETKDDLIRLYSSTIFRKAAEAPSMTEFEKAAEDALRDYLISGNFVTFGPEVVIEYMAALENEIVSLRIILTGKLMGIDAETLRERLRECYV